MRDNFDQKTKDVLFKRARAKCSNPECRRETSLAHSESNKAINLGEAAHITAASPGGARYDPTLSVEQRKDIRNGIWLCGTCAKLIDSDSPKYAVEVLQAWKTIAEAGDERAAAKIAVFSKIEKMMPELLKEMRKDLEEYPLARQFILMNKSAHNNGDENFCLVYYYDTHDYLGGKITILCNHHLIVDVTDTNVKRYRFSEDLVDYLGVKYT